jgi:hypothetical protein
VNASDQPGCEARRFVQHYLHDLRSESLTRVRVGAPRVRVPPDEVKACLKSHDAQSYSAVPRFRMLRAQGGARSSPVVPSASANKLASCVLLFAVSGSRQPAGFEFRITSSAHPRGLARILSHPDTVRTVPYPPAAETLPCLGKGITQRAIRGT